VKFNIGTASHALLLEGIDTIAVIEAEDWRTNAAKKERDEAYKQGRTPLLRHQYDGAKAMVDVALQSIYGCKELKITDLRADGDSELSWFWKERAPGGGEDQEIWLRVRPDWISKDRKLLLDYKTTGLSANPTDWGRQAVNMGYDIQDSLYCRGVKAIEGIYEKLDPKMVFLIQEDHEPYLCSFVGLPPDFLELGKSKVEFGMAIWQECLSSGIWYGYPSQVCWANLPSWASAAWETRAMEISI
jgi:hypothetical protein